MDIMAKIANIASVTNNMDIMAKIAIIASVIIITIVGIGVFNIYNDNSAECQEMDKDLFEHELAFNSSARQYRYQANALEGKLDLPGDLASWRNHLQNEYNQLQHDIKTFENRCQV